LTIKAVLFDMGYTLIKPNFTHPSEVFQRILASLDIPKSVDDVKKAFLNAEKEWKVHGPLSAFGRMDRESYWLKWDAFVLRHLGINENAELTKTVQSKWDHFVAGVLYPEVQTVLSELKAQKLKIGLISNIYEEGIKADLEKAGLGRSVFDVIVGVDAVGHMKPHPDVFRIALEKLKVKPEEGIFVGDDVEADYKGAKNAGLRAVLIDRTGKQYGDAETIKTLKEVLTLTH
jgi:putative hydrolase of the HAD superfamily